MEKANDESFARVTRKTAEDEKDWDRTLYKYYAVGEALKWPVGLVSQLNYDAVGSRYAPDFRIFSMQPRS
jgi:hypothetical protein